MAKSTSAPSDLADKFMLRMPPGLKDRLAAAAKQSGRSINQEIVSRLELSLDRFSSLEGIVSDVDDLKKFVEEYGPNIILMWRAIEQIESSVQEIDDHLRIKSSRPSILISGDRAKAENDFAREFPRLLRPRAQKDPEE